MRRRGDRRRRRRRSTAPNHERWLVSYADFITLLFAFFVVMYATAQVDKHKVGKLSAAIETAFQEWGPSSVRASQPTDADSGLPQVMAPISPPPRGLMAIPQANSDLKDLEKELEQTLAPEILRHEVAMHFDSEGLVISLREVGFFGSGSAQLTPSSRSALDRMAASLAQCPHRIRIEGHTDNVPIHNSQFPSNWELSTARATELIRMLIVTYKFLPERLSAAGYAEYHPLASNDTVEGRAANRRLDVVILRIQPEPPEGAPSSANPAPTISLSP